jgi:pimeloyl-ACP methyl ester carboxylesterase
MTRNLSSSVAQYKNHASRFIEIDGRRIHYRDEGEGPALVLLHGVMASLHTWDGWVERLAQHYRILRIDLPGFGFSDDLPADQYKPGPSARLFDQLRQAFGLERVHIAGNSLGGLLAWYYAAHYPQHVDKLILIDPIAYPQKLPSIMQFVSLPGVGELARFITPRALVAQNVREVYGDPRNIAPDTIDRYYQLLMHGDNRRAMVRMFRTIKLMRDDPEIARAVSKVKAPTLLMWGGRDRWVPPSLIERWRADVRDLRVKLYPELGHIPMEERPELTAQDAHAFLQGQPES